eukprot:TRINITY_DN20639_c0_g1_i2.p1 TRINITY_DN20639_c0_g1~~TRINITY_DN20639_c0_g1_i2.p1  ORF type:complete len:592 (+),score=108.53 TRINITY_DN20639_c0_g1_i2:1052-2827(+)
MRITDSDELWRSEVKPLVRSHCGAFVYFRRPSCPSCNFLAPKIYDAANDFDLKHGSDVLFVEVDVDRCPRTARTFGVDFVPAFRVFGHGMEREAFSGVSTRVVNDALSRLDASVLCCPQCTGDARSSFEAIEEGFEDVLQTGRLPGGAPLEIAAGDCEGDNEPLRVPAVECVLPFDFHDSRESAVRRLELLKDRLGRSAGTSTLGKKCRVNLLATDFLAAYPDEGMDVRVVRRLAYDWLRAKCGHPSLWSTDEWQAFNKMADATVSRRGTRAEYWLLRSLQRISGRKSSLRAWSLKIRSTCHEQLNSMWVSVRPCVRQCACCCLPCVLVNGHDGKHSCNTDDHKCHRTVSVTEASDATTAESFSNGARAAQAASATRPCVLHAGHAGCCSATLPEQLAWNHESACAICLDPLRSLLTGVDHTCEGAQAEREVIFQCRHAFHLVCVQPWLDRNQSCPLCRSPTNAKASTGGLSGKGLRSAARLGLARLHDESDRDRDLLTDLRQLRRRAAGAGGALQTGLGAGAPQPTVPALTLPSAASGNRAGGMDGAAALLSGRDALAGSLALSGRLSGRQPSGRSSHVARLSANLPAIT